MPYLDLRSERRFRNRFVLFIGFSLDLALALPLGFLFFFLVFEGPLKVGIFSCSGIYIGVGIGPHKDVDIPLPAIMP